jgi:hypothetical protein
MKDLWFGSGLYEVGFDAGKKLALGFGRRLDRFGCTRQQLDKSGYLAQLGAAL